MRPRDPTEGSSLGEGGSCLSREHVTGAALLHLPTTAAQMLHWRGALHGKGVVGAEWGGVPRCG